MSRVSSKILRLFYSSQRLQWSPIAIGTCWLAIVLGAITTRMPYVDEGFYSLAAHNRVTRGNWGAPEIEPSAFVYANIDKPLTRIASVRLI